MRIGILTFHYALNQGAVLQAFALQTVLEKLGHEVEFIDYIPPRHTSLKDFFAKTIDGTVDKLRNQFNGYKFRRNDEFSKVLKRGGKRYDSFESLQVTPPEYDLYICGSDQIWHFPNRLDEIYLMSWVPKGKKIVSYAASLGQNFPNEQEYPSLKNALSRFSSISIREDKGRDFIQSLIGPKITVQQTLDPTLLLHSEDYERIMSPINESRDYIASYILTQITPEHSLVIQRACSYMRLPLVNLRNPDTCSFLKEYDNRIVNPYQWLHYIRKSSAVICSSFHAVVFALIFHRPFIVLQTEAMREKGGNIRVMSLLSMVGLTHHCIYACEDKNIEILLDDKIDWESIDEKLKSYIIPSIDFIKDITK